MTATTVLATDISENRTIVAEERLLIVADVDFNDGNGRIPYIFLGITPAMSVT